ncbi:hypothetical protein [Spirosoma flavum]|uniref:Lipoprotein n=1 Tax=Spirosoma flavum TaxID=2048557 RepID=A0ABW6ARL0_9BACT
MARLIRGLLFGLLVCISSCHSVDSSIALTNEDYKVYSAYINSFSFYKNASSADTIIITDSTTSISNDIRPNTRWSGVTAMLGERCHYLKDTASCRKVQDPVWASLFENVKLSSHTKQESLLPVKFTVHYPIQLLSQFRKKPFEQKWDDSLPYYLFGLSRIAYNADTTKALFFGSFICGGTCGRGELVLMEKMNQTWLLIDTFRFWIY